MKEKKTNYQSLKRKESGNFARMVALTCEALLKTNFGT
jgi:hypothetical protein